MVTAGIGDDRVEVHQLGLAGCLRYRSLHTMAGFTYWEGNTALHRTRWVEHPRNLDGAVGRGGLELACSDADVRLEQLAGNDAAGAAGLSHTKPCARCRQPFTAKRKDARFCSTRCQVAAHRSAA
jgi:hypothetical protein